MAAEPIIRGVDAHKVYNSGVVKVHALRGVNLAIPSGEMVAIMGPSGCGKTTLLNCFSGLDDLTSGDVLIEGVSLASMDDNAKSRYRSRRMGFVFQTYNLLPVLTAGGKGQKPPPLPRGAPPEGGGVGRLPSPLHQRRTGEHTP